MYRDADQRLRAKIALRKERERDRARDDAFVRETFTLPRDAAREHARAFLSAYPRAAYMSAVDGWRELPDGQIEFTMRRLPSAD